MGNSNTSRYAPLETVKDLNLQEYISQRWFQLAAIPQWYQLKCKSNVFAEYKEDPLTGYIVVRNTCKRRLDGKFTSTEGRARIDPNFGQKSKLQVTFLLTPLGKWWFLKNGGNYWIIEYDMLPGSSGEKYALVGSPDRKSLWLLCSTPKVKEEEVQTILKRAAEIHGFNTRQLEWTEHEYE